MEEYDQLLVTLFNHPPDPNEPLPLSNRRGTIYGVTLTFLITSWAAIFFRLWVRFKIVKEPGWDDFFVFLSGIFNTAATVCVCLATEHGLGTHFLYLHPSDMQSYLFFFWLANNLYMTETTFIKISLLLQYLRIFKAGLMRWICIILIIIISMWGIGFSFSGWFSCDPVRAAWDRLIPFKCFGFGFGDVRGFITAFRAHSTTNVILDITVFLTPMVLFQTPNLRLKNMLAMAGVFIFGGVVIATTVWRLHGIIKTKAATHPYMDFTWWTPPIIILTCLEIDLAIICASMPIFWPVLEKSLAAIFVSYEVQILEEETKDYGLSYELEHRTYAEGSMKSSGSSTHELSADGKGDCEIDGGHVKREFTVGVDPLNEEARMGGLRTDIMSVPKSRWEL